MGGYTGPAAGGAGLQCWWGSWFASCSPWVRSAAPAATPNAATPAVITTSTVITAPATARRPPILGPTRQSSGPNRSPDERPQPGARPEGRRPRRTLRRPTASRSYVGRQCRLIRTPSPTVHHRWSAQCQRGHQAARRARRSSGGRGRGRGLGVGGVARKASCSGGSPPGSCFDDCRVNPAEPSSASWSRGSGQDTFPGRGHRGRSARAAAGIHGGG